MFGEITATELRNQGNALFRKNNFNEALSCYQQATEKDPTIKEIWFNIGVCQRKLNQPESAIAAFNQALTLDSGYEKATHNRSLAITELATALKTQGNIAFKAGHTAAALALYQRAAAIDPGLKEAWGNQAVCHHQLGQWEDAIRTADRALTIDPDYVKIFSLKARIISKDNPAQAYPLISNFLLRHPEEIVLWKLKQKCAAMIHAEVFFGVIDLKLTPEGKVVILEFGRGMQSGLLGFDKIHAEADKMPDRLRRCLSGYRLPIFINNMPGQMVTTHASIKVDNTF